VISFPVLGVAFWLLFGLGIDLRLQCVPHAREGLGQLDEFGRADLRHDRVEPGDLPLVDGGENRQPLGALLPAGWAARTRTATALRTE